MSMFGPKPGSWSLSSEDDPRWNCSGRSEAMLVVAGICDEARDAIKDMTQRFGAPPADLSYSCMKD